MKFPKAAAGVKKIYTSQLLALFATVAMIIALITTVITLAATMSDATGTAVGSTVATGIFFVVSGVLVLVGAVLNLVGIIQASKDEASFKAALYCVIIGVICSVVAAAFPNNNVLTGIFSSLQQVFSLAVTVFVIQGVIRLADKLNRGDVSSKGSTLLKIMLIIYLLIIVAVIVAAIFGGYAVSIISAILLICASVLQIVQYFMYLNFLSNAKKMLIKG